MKSDPNDVLAGMLGFVFLPYHRCIVLCLVYVVVFVCARILVVLFPLTSSYPYIA